MYSDITTGNFDIFKCILFQILPLIFFVCFVPSGFAEDFTFEWDANHPNDNVVKYRIYWSTTSGGYNTSNRQDIPVSGLTDPSNPKYTLSLSNASADQTYFFVCSAVDNHGYESDFSNEINTADQDTTAPVLNTAPRASDITFDSAVITWTTDESCDSEVRYGISSSTWNNYAWSSAKDAMVKTHAITLSSLSQGQKYYYRIASTDSSGNRIVSNEYSFTTVEDQDTTAPEFTSWPMVTDTTDDTAIIEWSTNEQSDSTIRYGLAPSTWENYNSEIGSSTMTQNHQIILVNLKGSTTYYFRVASRDLPGNGPLISNEQTFTTEQEPDEEEPEIISPPTVITIFETDAGIQSGVINTSMVALATEDGNISVAISWRTDELSNSEVRYGKKSTTWDQYRNTVVDDAFVKKHTVILTGLREGELYYFRAGSTDVFGNGPTSDPNEINNPFKELSFRIEKPSDNEAPRILNGPHLKAMDKDSAVIVWETDEPASSMLQYGLSKAEWGGFDHSKVITDMRTDHSVTINGLSATTQYFFMVGAMDATGNGPSKNDNLSNPSAVDSFWTTGIADEKPPDISGIEVVYTTDTTALIQWETDEPGNSMVQYDLNSRTWGQYEYSSNDSEMVISHQLTLTRLRPDTIYYFRLSSTDASGNGPGADQDLSNPSEEKTFQTTAEPDVNAPQISEVNIIMRDDGQSVVVEWVTDEPGNSQVAYGPKSGEWGSYAYHENSPELTREHTVALTNLEKDILYYIRVSSIDASGNDYETLENDDNPSKELTFQLGSDRVANDSVTDSASEAACFINATGK